MTFIEVLVAIVLLGTAVIAALTAVRATVIATAVERDHSKAQQWLQSAVGEIDSSTFQDCAAPPNDPVAIAAAYAAMVAYYTSEVTFDDRGTPSPADDTGAQPPEGFSSGQISITSVEVWDGTSYVDFAAQAACADNDSLRQQLVTIQVTSPDGRIIETVQAVKYDRA